MLALVVLLLALQWRLWVADGGLGEAHRLHEQLKQAQMENEQLRLRNFEMDAEVKDLNSGHAAIESRARISMGMIRPDESFYLVVRES